MSPDYAHTAIEQALQGETRTAGPPSLPFLLAGPIVRRAEPDAVWFWIACSQEVTGCTPRVTAFDSSGAVDARIAGDRGWIPQNPPGLRIARLGERLWVVLVSARPQRPFAPGHFYGYELDITTPRFTTTLAAQGIDVAYRPFRLPTFVIGGEQRRLAHGSCRRPGADARDAYPAFDAWLAEEVSIPLIGTTTRRIASSALRPSALLLTGDQIYADDVATELFGAVRQLARDVFGHVEQLPALDGRGSVSVDDYGLPQPPGAGAGSRAPEPPTRKQLTARPGSPIGFTTDDGEAHLLSFAEFAAMYLLVSSEQLCRGWRVERGSNPNLAGFCDAVAASRRVMANMATYMVCDDHEITDDWNLDADWVRATSNPTARRVIANGLAAYWAFQAWGNDPDRFESLKAPVLAHLGAMRAARGVPGAAGAEYDRELHAHHWSFVAATSPPALCVDTRTRREFPPGAPAVLSGPRVWPFLTQLSQRPGRFRRGDPLLVVLPTPLIVHPMLTGIQHRARSWPRDRYRADWELYSDNPAQRADLIQYLRRQFDPSSLVIFSGDVHLGSVHGALYAGGADRAAIESGRGAWALKVAQVTSSPIKNANADLRSYGNIGESVFADHELRFTEDGSVGMFARAAALDGPLGHRTFIPDSHLCVVDIESAGADPHVAVRFIGGTAAAIKTATTTVGLHGGPGDFRVNPLTHRLMSAAAAHVFPLPADAPPATGAHAMSTYLQTAIEDAMELELARAASGGSPERPAPASPPRPAPAPAVTPEATARAGAIQVRDFIKATARTRAATALSVDTSSRFYRRLVDFYLRDYLAAPSAATGRSACETRIGRTFAGPATPGDYWEEGALRSWNHQAIPAAARRLRPALPAELAAATDVLSRPNRAILPYIDVPQLIGGANTSTGLDADVSGGGKNISQLMHWATGAKYSHIDRLTMRELFIAYELWHLEAWDVFGEDPINDLIAEESGRILGAQLRAAGVTGTNLQARLNDAFAEARAWVGTLLRARLAELDAWTVAETQRRANIWWGAAPAMDVWGPDTISTMLRRGMSVDDVKRSSLVERIIGIYTLVSAADTWEAAHGRIDNGSLIPRILNGSLDRIFQRMARGETVTSWDVIGLEDSPAAALEAPIEDYHYDSTGTRCSGAPTPGASALVRELGRRFTGHADANDGYVCRNVRGRGTLSLHGEGRAVDWYLNAADTAQAAEAQRIIDWLLGSDSQGNADAVARRMGVQEIIWNRRVWSAGRTPRQWRDYGGENPHTDHLHIGLSHAGAALRTSFWTSAPAAHATAAGQPSLPPAAPVPATPPPSPAPAGAGLRNAADIDAAFRRSSGQDFLDWFHATQANRGAWAGKDVRRDADTRRRFAQFWDGAAANVFGQPAFSLEQFVALQSIFINELGGAMAPVTERMGRPGHPGMAYLFDRIEGVKSSYNVAPNRTALECFNDAEFLAAHGALAPGARLAHTTTQAWGGTTWPAGEPTDIAAAPFIAQADFCRFRGRGMIQTTWRSAYGAIVRWVQAYTGANAKIVEYRTRWAGQGVERVLSRSSNADWDDLFQNSDYAIPWAGIRLHAAGAGSYLAIAADATTRNGTGAGSFHNMGRRISGSGSYGDLFKRRCVQILDALAGSAPAAAPPRAQALEGGPPPASELTWDGATAAQLAFKRRVYEIHVARSRRTRAFVANVPSGELTTIPGTTVPMRSAAAAACGRLVAAAAAALSEAKARGDALASAAEALEPGSGYRSVTTQFNNWNRNFQDYYDQTRAERTRAPGGEHGEQAAELTARHIGGVLGAPGFSLHNNGLAIDFVTRQGAVRLGASTGRRAAWRASWAWSWLAANAASFDFFQNASIDEPWHWEYRPAASPAVSVGHGLAAHEPAVIPAGSQPVARVAMLAAHHDVGPDLFLRWNAIPDLAAGVDVVVHLHGFSSNRHLQVDVQKLPVSGLDFTPPAVPSGTDARPHPAWSGRTRPTLLVLPRGRAVAGHDMAYDFPALVAAGGLAALIGVAVHELAAAVGAGGTEVPVRRLILTAHSGGGSALDAILRQTAGTAAEPHEVHVFDALYGSPDGVLAWLRRRLSADVARLGNLAEPADADMAVNGGALRILYLPQPPGINPRTGRPYAATERSSLAIRDAVRAGIPAGRPFSDVLDRHYRVERARVGHSLIPYWYGGRLLADATSTF